MPDYAHTSKATHNRQVKAEKLATAAAARGYQIYELAIEKSTHANERRREIVRKSLGLRSRPSDETWSVALEVLRGRAFETTRGETCVKCAAPILRVRTLQGALLDLDPFAHPDGTVWPRQQDGRVVAVVLAGHDTPPEETPLFRQHSRSCPHSPEGSKRRLREAPLCRVCQEPLHPELAYRWAEYHTHPCCYDDEGGDSYG